MQGYSLTHLADHELLRDLVALVSQDRRTTAALLAHLAEVDARRLYLPAGFPSLHAWSVGKLGLGEESAFKRIQAARACRRIPALYVAVADGRLHLTAVVLLAPHLTSENADEWIGLAAHQTRGAIEKLLTDRFAAPCGCQQLEVGSPPVATKSAAQLDSNPVGGDATECVESDSTAGERRPGEVAPPVAPGPCGPGSSARVTFQFAGTPELADDVRYALALGGYPPGDAGLARLFAAALKSHIAALEKRRFAATSRSRPQRSRGEGRYVPAEVRREVWQRDGGRCTFVSETGHRCESRTHLEFDHEEPFARGGASTTANLRLRCRAHNQFDAERTFGKGFVAGRREAARGRAAQERARRAAAQQRAEAEAAARARAEELVPWLRQLGCRPEEARQAASLANGMPDAPLGERLRVAIRSLAPASARRMGPVACGST